MLAAKGGSQMGLIDTGLRDRKGCKRGDDSVQCGLRALILWSGCHRDSVRTVGERACAREKTDQENPYSEM